MMVDNWLSDFAVVFDVSIIFCSYISYIINIIVTRVVLIFTDHFR